MLDKVADKVAKGVRAWQAHSLAPLETPLFRWLWLAAMASNFGAVIQMIGASWTMTTLDPSAHIVALVQTAALLPIVIFALPAGALADTADRRALMLTSQILGLIATIILIVFAYSGMMTPWMLLAGTALVGASMALHTPAWQASFADLVPRQSLPAAVGLSSLAYNVARSLGPAFGGFIIAAAGASATFVINAVSFLGLIAVLAMNKLPRPQVALPPEPVGQAMLAGLRYTIMSPMLKSIFVRGALFGFGGSAVWSLAPLITQQRIGGGSIEYGLLLGGFGAGSLIAATLSASVRAYFGNERLFNLSSVAFAISTVFIGLSTLMPITLVFMTIAGAAWIFTFTTTSTCIQFCSPRWVMGRAVALSQVSVVGSIATGAAFWGYIAERSSLLIAFACAGVFLALSLLLTFLAPLPGRDFEDLSPHPAADAPTPALKVESATGPIFITIEYDVPRDRLEEFLATMYAIGRIRKRDGARRWGIQQDIDNPNIWVEHIESATWVDHLRRAHRATVADQAVRRKAASFRCKGANSIRRTVERPQGSTPLD